MIAIIDNYDSFTYNLVQLLAELGARVGVFRNDVITLKQLTSGRYRGLVVSPGPGTPDDAGLSCASIQHVAGRMPVLGVCLGHQCIGQLFGGDVVRAPELMHGKSSLINHGDTGLYAGMPNPFLAARYHSLVVSGANLPTCLEVTAQTADGTIMGLRHKRYDIEGVQYHPESILTAHGRRLLANFLQRTGVSELNQVAHI